MKRKDAYLASVIGFTFGVLLLLPLNNVGFTVTPKLVFTTVVGFTVLAPVLLFALYFCSRFVANLYEFGKFAAVGALNTMIDLGVLNLLITLTNLSTGFYYSLFKGVSFVSAVLNSYLWNKFWTFSTGTPVGAREFGRFIFFTLIGLVINVSVATLVVDLGEPVFGLPARAAANAGAIFATVISLLWNFFAYKKFVFR
ncbi:MAG TPA: GtrA family protein [Candidatus Paceibacterota bacterium]|nr:GtrA family protein [Candidatus Paceibacterota bacterium]